MRVTRLTYGEAESRLGEEPLSSLYRRAQVYQARRQSAGAIRLEFPEVDISVEGEQIIIRPILPLRSRDLVTEELGIAGVEGLAEAGQPLLPGVVADDGQPLDRVVEVLAET